MPILKFDIHVEKVIEIVLNVPTFAVCHQVVSYLLTKELEIVGDKEIHVSSETSGELKMMNAVLKRVPPNLAYSALAAALLSILNLPSEKFSIEVICAVVGSITALLGNHYDGCLLVNSLLNCKTIEYNKIDFILLSRLVFECITLMVPATLIHAIVLRQSRAKVKKMGSDDMDMGMMIDHAALEELSVGLLRVKKIVLSWYLSSQTRIAEEKKREREDKLHKNGNFIPELDEPNFSSVLDGEMSFSVHKTEDAFMDILTCLLFLNEPGSKQVEFLLQAGSSNYPSETEELSEEKKIRIQACMAYGCHIDNNIFRIVINSVVSNQGPIDAHDAISLIELILFVCKENKKSAIISVDDCDIIWDLYKLSKYTPNVSKSNIPE